MSPFSSPLSHMRHVTHDRTPIYYMTITLSHQLPFSCFNLKALKKLRGKKSFLREMIHKFQPVTKGVIAYVPFAHDLIQSFSVLPKQSLL